MIRLIPALFREWMNSRINGDIGAVVGEEEIESRRQRAECRRRNTEGRKQEAESGKHP